MGARGNPALDLNPPNETTLREMRMILLHQFTFISAPHIWNGDERGMWGGDDPDCRKPIVWEDIDHRRQTYRPDGKKTKPTAVKPNLELLDYYRILIALRKQRPELVHGKLEYILVNDKAMTLAYRSTMADLETIVAFNRSDKSQIIRLSRNTNKKLKLLAESRPGSLAKWKQADREIRFELAPLSGVALGTVQ
jgi:glycosidase